ncbi:hypothetical protein DICPUDRAFT_52670 [Dictyostelium purpureum]|uniref:TCTP domain-containing protein n=1 Tax=Dictyostelium purpureum TaxID=5786 RepID=F0Z9H2_DICPU|nr:uncharacterized protein DICPUDRAFT_52670 [Dictyostelium purpureum]EGC39381.1 hypothetical protein DICPUDRAFT_52670 [Dictyostelium purpureum]|eukprot:XP_003284055.1 hypothetical protein DICPUDRAFT_52670 [Dictyostelium purpureum]
MKVFKDILGYYHDELLSDAFEIEEKDVVYEVKTKMITKDLDVKVDIGANASEEEGDEGVDSAGLVQVNNLVDSMRLTETSFDKKGYLTYIKGYMKALSDKLSETNPSRVDAFKSGAQEYIKGMVGQFSEYKFYQGENMDADGLVVLSYYKNPEDPAPTFVYFKDGLEAVKY